MSQEKDFEKYKGHPVPDRFENKKAGEACRRQQRREQQEQQKTAIQRERP